MQQPHSYDVILADTPETRRQHFRLRYLVFCQERNFEPPEAFPNGLETDEHDRHALHFLIRQRRPHAPWFGAFRLLLPSGRPRPIEAMCSLAEDVPHERRGEVSRLIVRHSAPRHSQTALFRLCRAAHQAATEHALDQLLFLVRPGLRRMLNHRGLPLKRFGEPCCHRGLRYPCGNGLGPLGRGLEHWQCKEGYPGHQQEEPAYRRASALIRPSGTHPALDQPLRTRLPATPASAADAPTAG